jgi:hypothetical protein
MTPFFLDVHVPAAISTQIRSRIVDVLTAPEDGRTELLDSDLLAREPSNKGGYIPSLPWNSFHGTTLGIPYCPTLGIDSYIALDKASNAVSPKSFSSI